MLFLYNVLFVFFALLYLPFFFIKGKHRGGWAGRFGKVPAAVRKDLAARRVIWVHAVSVGEVVAGARLLDALRRRFPAVRFVLTTTTMQGREVAERIKGEEDTLLTFPMDFPFCVRSFVDAVSPRTAVILETELWPNVIAELSRRGIPIFVVNGRISDKAIGRYRLIGPFMKRFLNCLSGVGVQDERMRSRFLSLGVDPRLVRVTGNLKFDWRPPAVGNGLAGAIETKFGDPESFLCVAGSTHDGEERLFFDIFRSVRGRIPNFKLLVAPRHLDRLAAVEERARRMEVPLCRVSAVLRDGGRAAGGPRSALLLDRMGILAALYRAADVVFVGGSLVPGGGHNLVEPAFFEKPILFGPFMSNFQEMAEEFKKAHAAVEVKDAADLENQILSLAGDARRRKSLGSAAKGVLRRHEGAAERNVSELLDQAAWAIER